MDHARTPSFVGAGGHEMISICYPNARWNALTSLFFSLFVPSDRANNAMAVRAPRSECTDVAYIYHGSAACFVEFGKECPIYLNTIARRIHSPFRHHRRPFKSTRPPARPQ